MLWLLTILPGLVVWSIRGRKRRVEGWQALAQRGRVPRDGTALVVGAIASLIVALAQPRWGRLAASPLPPGHDVVLVVDVSQSMAVEDAVPNRLAAAIEAAESLVNALAREPANRAAVVAFAGRGVLRCPLTENLGAVLDALHRLRPGAVRPGGTDLGAALDAAREAFDSLEHAEGRAIVVFSDGEDHAEKWCSCADRLRQEGIMVHAVAIGDAEQGHPVPAGKSAQPLLYHGERVLSRRYDALARVDRTPDGRIDRAIGDGDRRSRQSVSSQDRARGSPTARIVATGRPGRTIPTVLDRRAQFPCGRLLAGPARLAWPWIWRWHRSLRKPGVALLLLALAGLTTGAGDAPTHVGSDSAAEAVARGQAAYGVGQFEAALAAFETAIARAPASAIGRYNAAAALFQLGRYSEASQRYVEARERAGSSLRTKIDFVRGNTALADGDIPGAIRSYDECLASTARGAALDAVRRDAAINRQFALEQPQSLSLPESNNSGDRSDHRNPDRRKGPNRQGSGQSTEGQPESDQGSGGTSPDAEEQGDRQRPPAAGAGSGEQAADRTRVRRRTETRRTTASTPHSSTSGPPRLGDSLMRSPTVRQR